MTLFNDWQLYYVEDNLFDGNISSVSRYPRFENVTVPTLFEKELYRNKVEGDPYYSANTWDYQKYESYHQFYVCKFKSNRKHKLLRLNGVDTLSEIYVNGKLIGKTDNMFIPYTFELNDLNRENELIIHILPCVLEGKKYECDKNELFAFKYNYEGLHIRKSAHSFGWDILPRTPLGGIHKSVELLDSLPLIKDVHISSYNISKESADLRFEVSLNNGNVKDYQVEIEGRCKDSHFVVKNGKAKINKPYLWNIRFYGKPNLYTINIRIYKDNKLIESKRIKYGIRKVELFRSSTVSEDGKFEFHINGQKVFLLGANWTPVDAIDHVNESRMLKTLDLVEDIGCNAVRIWGGGTYELDKFYEECDKRGIFIWHDFMMGCAVYPKDVR